MFVCGTVMFVSLMMQAFISDSTAKRMLPWKRELFDKPELFVMGRANQRLKDSKAVWIERAFYIEICTIVYSMGF